MPEGTGGVVGTGGAGGSGGASGKGGTSGAAGSSGDAGLDGGVTECAQRGGECQSVPLTADTYAWCATFSGTPCMLPAPAYEGVLGCTAGGDGVMPVCCLPPWDQPPGQCVNSGGACYPAGTAAPGEVCPLGWGISNATCEPESDVCCEPPIMLCPPWP